MLKFFRRIRQNLLKENRFSKYLLYAIGEIILVVIGILIALQVTNWNEIQKDEKFENEILSLIDQNLEQDSISLSVEMSKSKLAVNLTNRLIERVSIENYGDSLNFWMGKIISFERFRSQSSAYEMLKAKGLENISDRPLQMALISYYDGNLFRVYQALNDVELQFNKDWTPVIKEEFTDFVWVTYCRPINQEKFFKNTSNITLFKLFKDNRSGSVRHLQNAIDKISEIRELIKKTK